MLIWFNKVRTGFFKLTIPFVIAVAAFRSITEYYKTESWLNMSSNADPCLPYYYLEYYSHWYNIQIGCEGNDISPSMNMSIVTKLLVLFGFHSNLIFIKYLVLCLLNLSVTSNY
jgi:hypothetical protein